MDRDPSTPISSSETPQLSSPATTLLLPTEELARSPSVGDMTVPEWFSRSKTLLRSIGDLLPAKEDKYATLFSNIKNALEITLAILEEMDERFISHAEERSPSQPYQIDKPDTPPSSPFKLGINLANVHDESEDIKDLFKVLDAAPLENAFKVKIAKWMGGTKWTPNSNEAFEDFVEKFVPWLVTIKPTRHAACAHILHYFHQSCFDGWYNLLTLQQRTTPSVLLQELHDRYKARKTSQQFAAELTVVQQRHDTVLNFATRCQHLFVRAYPNRNERPESVLISSFCTGLRPKLKESLYPMPTTFKAALNKALEVEKALDFAHPPDVSQQRQRKPKPKPTITAGTTTTITKRPKYCFYCKVDGHHTKDCVHKKCSNCGSTEHWKSRCPKANNSTAPAARKPNPSN